MKELTELYKYKVQGPCNQISPQLTWLTDSLRTVVKGVILFLSLHSIIKDKGKAARGGAYAHNPKCPSFLWRLGYIPVVWNVLVVGLPLFTYNEAALPYPSFAFELTRTRNHQLPADPAGFRLLNRLSFRQSTSRLELRCTADLLLLPQWYPVTALDIRKWNMEIYDINGVIISNPDSSIIMCWHL